MNTIPGYKDPLMVDLQALPKLVLAAAVLLAHDPYARCETWEQQQAHNERGVELRKNLLEALRVYEATPPHTRG